MLTPEFAINGVHMIRFDQSLLECSLFMCDCNLPSVLASTLAEGLRRGMLGGEESLQESLRESQPLSKKNGVPPFALLGDNNSNR